MHNRRGLSGTRKTEDRNASDKMVAISTTSCRTIDGSNEQRSHFRKTTVLYLARGPVIVIAVVISLFYPYFRDYCVVRVLLHLAMASIGLVWICRDVSRIAESGVKYGLNFVLDRLVLDDVMRAIYHPTEGLWACFVGTYLGASSMYGLEMNEEERTELVHSSLFLNDKNQAHTVLLQPGGCKELLPKDIQSWLQNEESSQIRNDDRNEYKPGQFDSPRASPSPQSLHSTESDKSTSDCDTADVNEQDDDSRIVEEGLDNIGESDYAQHYNDIPIHSFKDERYGGSSRSDAHRGNIGSASKTHQEDPVVVFFRILRNMALQRIRSYAKTLPRAKIENVGMAAASALAVQLALRRSAFRRSPLICAGITTLSLGTILSREAILGNIYSKESMKNISKDIASRLLKRLKETSPSKRAFFGMLALLLLCKKKRATIQ